MICWLKPKNSLWLRDVLFRIGVYRGIAVASPPDLINCTLVHMCQFHRVFETTINPQHYLASWLYDDCLGPWAMRMQRPLHYRQTYMAFARPADAMSFRLLTAK